MKIHRVVTKHEDGKSVVADDVPQASGRDFEHIPDMGSALLWATPPVPTVPFDGRVPTDTITSWVPEPGATRFMVVQFPPDEVFMSPNFNPAAAGAEQLEANPGLAEAFEPENPGMHTTDTVDYGLVLSGAVSLELDDGEEIELAQGDVVVQNGTRHAWRVRGGEPATMAFILIGAERKA